LFLLVNDIVDYVYKFADDTSIYCFVDNESLNLKTESLHQWALDKGVTLNASKTKYVYLAVKIGLIFLFHKHLGLKLCSNVKWSYLIKKIYTLKKLKHKIDLDYILLYLKG